MDFNAQLNEAFRVVREGRLAEKSEDELCVILQVLRQYYSAQCLPSTLPAIDAIENELSRRQIKKENQKLLEQSRTLHGEVMEEHRKLKSSVDELREPHWTMTPSFWVSVAAMIFAAIAAWPVIRAWIHRH